MIFNEILELYTLLDRPGRVAPLVASLFEKEKQQLKITRVTGDQGKTDFVKIIIPGKNGKTNGGKSPTIGIIGRFGGIGARPERIGFNSNGDGAFAPFFVSLVLT